ncbi:hypothetical protein Tco_1415311 [Tanacetum coccineum]
MNRSDNYIESNFNNKWLQSAGLHSFYSSNPNLPPLQDFGFYAGGDGDGSRINRNLQRGNGGNADGMTPTGFTKYGSGEQVSPSEFSPGLLDLHSFDTEFLTEVVN